MTKIVTISDTHLRRVKDIPDGTVLIHTGDLTFTGTLSQVIEGFDKLALDLVGTNFRKKFFVPGNHDWLFETNPALGKQLCERYGWELLHDSLVEFDGLKIFGSATQPEFCNWSFNENNTYRENFWKNAPDCDILAVHAPAHQLLDV